MNVGVNDVLALERLERYQGDAPAHEAILVLARILERGAVKRDYGRAEVLRTLLHIYEVLFNQPKEQREEWKPLGSPREILLPIVRHDIGSEETFVLEERIHQLLYHDWISHIRGIDKFVFRMIESPHLSATLYEILLTKMLATLRGDCTPKLHRDKANDQERPMLFREKPEQWPCLPDRLFMPLWDSPRATAEHRDKLYGTLENVMLAGEAGSKLVQTGAKYLFWLRQRGAVSPQQVQSYIDRVVSESDPATTGRGGHLPSLFPDVYEACPHWRSQYSPPKWDAFNQWW